MKAEQLPRVGCIRFVPPKNWNPSNPAKGPGGGVIDRFGNEWVREPTRPAERLSSGTCSSPAPAGLSSGERRRTCDT
ncbi:polymorphic toxin type 17 domain-containing protein [Sorangium sp. So ce302]|uniref:polymorphic toxin type 17 domain-containing protein n=1 Tax=Sorangium sp. So ce302 TaxID=3133297 RepID=UPI003F5FF258